VDVTAFTTRDDFLLELARPGRAGRGATGRFLDEALQSMAGGKRGQILAIDAREVADVRAAVDARRRRCRAPWCWCSRKDRQRRSWALRSRHQGLRGAAGRDRATQDPGGVRRRHGGGAGEEGCTTSHATPAPDRQFTIGAFRRPSEPQSPDEGRPGRPWMVLIGPHSPPRASLRHVLVFHARQRRPGGAGQGTRSRQRTGAGRYHRTYDSAPARRRPSATSSRKAR